MEKGIIYTLWFALMSVIAAATYGLMLNPGIFDPLGW